MAAASQAPSSVLVTGASGFVGSAIAREFRRHGHRVRVLVRAASPRVNIDPDDEVASGDIMDRRSVAAALNGVRFMVHAAADYRLWAPSPDDIMRTNVEGTRIVMEEAQRAGVDLRPARRGAGGRNPSASGRSGRRRLQAQQDISREPGGRHGRAGIARGHRQSVDADRAA
jgi:NAD(P)-dependent dehydrogenase (short-subunit alcohol dehydrogenase family)